GTKFALRPLMPGHTTTRGPLPFGSSSSATKADSQNLAPRQNFWDRNHCFGPRLSISRRTTEWQLPIGVTTVTASSLCCLQQIGTTPSDNSPKRSDPSLSKEAHPPAMRLESRLSAN